MKILIGTNTFGSYKRQDIAVESWLHLKTLYPDNVDLIDIQFKKDEATFEKKYDLKTVFPLRCSSKTWVHGSEKELPVVADLIVSIHREAENYDYFIFTNSDVIIMPHLIKYIMEKKPTCMACSRLDIDNIVSFDSVKAQRVTPVRYEIAGFDTFVFEKKWFEKNMDELLRGVYFLGKPLWDVILAGKMKLLGDDTPLGNDYPPYCFHIHHGLDSVTTECPEKTWAEDQMKHSIFDSLAHNIMFTHLKMNLLKRQPWGSFMQLAPNEKEFERNFFNLLNLHTEKRI
jgi:hypothetical protein